MLNPDCDSVVRELYDKKFLVFAGTGASKDAIVPDWKTLLQALLACYPIKGCNIDNIPSEEYCNVAQRIFNKLKREKIENRYYEIISEKIQPQNSPWAPIQLYIFNTTKWVVTTNFENSFEEALKFMYLGKETPEIYNPSLPTLNCENLIDRNSVIYLHGKADAHYIVFKKDDYDFFYPSVSKKRISSTVLENYLRFIYRDFTILFIGFSFLDEYVRKSLCNIYSDIEMCDQRTKPEK